MGDSTRKTAKENFARVLHLAALFRRVGIDTTIDIEGGDWAVRQIDKPLSLKDMLESAVKS